MKLHSFSRYLVAFVSTLLLASCGGGGSSTTTDVGGPLAVSPDGATFYAGVKYTITITGGRPPYELSSTEPSLLPLPATLDGHTLDVVPNNPSVIDTGLPPDALPVHTVTITARSSANGATAIAAIKIARNFLTGYGFSFDTSSCTTVPKPCAGGDTVIRFDSTFVGNLQPNRTYRIERVRGPFQFLDPVNSNNQADSILVTSDSAGRFTAIIRVAAGVPTQIALMRITEVSSGASVLESFIINGAANAGMQVIPASTTLTGPNANQCGSGTFDVLVFDGQPPYTAICPNPQILAQPATSSPATGQPGRFTFIVGSSNQCLTAEPCVITDSLGARTIVSITTVKGGAPASSPLVATPNAITLVCGATGNVTVTGGVQGAVYSVNSTHQRVVATVSGNTVSITRLTGDTTPPAPFPLSATVSVTDGATSTPITVTLTQATC